MKYIRNRMNYFRQEGYRIENTKEFYNSVKMQNDSEPIPATEAVSRFKFVFISISVLVILIFLIISGVNFVNSMDNPDELFENTAFVFSFIGCFFFVGLLFLGFPIVSGIRLKKKCTQESEAVCIGYDDAVVTNKHGAHFKSCPVYRFEEAGIEYTVYNNKYTGNTSSLPEIGSTESVLFDPENPNDCIIGGRVNWNIASIIVGAIFLFLTVAACFGILSDL